MPTIKFPNSCVAEDVFRFCSEMSANLGSATVCIDFSNMGRIEPFTMVYVAKQIRDFIKSSPGTDVLCINYEDKQYAANMAFFRAFGLKHGKEPNCGGGNDNFVPFTILRVKSVIDEAHSEYELEQDTIERKANQLSNILSREQNGDLVDALTFSIREILRNVLEHSRSKSMEYCAQYWPAHNKVEIAVADNGIGLLASLSANPYMQAKSHSDAIQQALMPAISAKNYKGARVDRSNPWHNTGFGLYMINRICRRGGSFLICSGDHAIKLNGEGKHHIELGHNCNGTVVRMVLNTCHLTNLAEMLAQFRDEGYEIAKEIKGVGIYSASAASQMLSRDFKK